MGQNAILKGYDLEKSRSSVKVKNLMRPLPFTRTRELSLKSYCQFFWYGRASVDQKVAGGKKEERKSIGEKL